MGKEGEIYFEDNSLLPLEKLTIYQCLYLT